MIKKRLVGVVTVKDGRAVQSFGYRRYLPLGKPEVLIENLDRWGADEIVLQCIDRTRQVAGPDLGLLERVSALGLSTPLIYAGGVRTVAEGIAAIQAGSDRICLDAVLHDDPKVAEGLANALGAQAVVAALPLSKTDEGIGWYDYASDRNVAFCPELVSLLKSGVISEAMVIDWQAEGCRGGFNMDLIDGFPVLEVPLIAFGGLSEVSQLGEALARPAVVAVGIGNFLAYREHAVQHYKLQLAERPLRSAFFENTLVN